MKRTGRLELDHFHRDRRCAGIALLLAALATAIALGMWRQSLLGDLEVLEAQAARSERSYALRTAAVDPGRMEEAARRARHIALELRLPWNDLFDAVEAAADPAVALLSIEPDVSRSALRVSGEARDKQAMLNYVKRLGTRPPVARAMLESHAELREGGPAVQFTLVAYWEPRP